MPIDLPIDLPIDATAALAALAIVALAAFAQSLTGFGFGLVAIPLLAVFVGPEEAVVAVTAISAVLSTGSAWRLRADVDQAAARTYIGTGLLGMAPGLALLLFVTERQLTLLVGVVVLLAVVAMALRLRARSRAVQLGAGVLGGALLTSTGMNGPPIVIGLDGREMEPARFRATIQVVFVVQDFAAVALFAAAGLVDVDVLLLVAVAALALPVGWALGSRVFARLSGEQFRWAMLAMLTASAAVAIISAV